MGGGGSKAKASVKSEVLENHLQNRANDGSAMKQEVRASIDMAMNKENRRCQSTSLI